MDLLSNWFIRINRKRKDPQFLQTLGYILQNFVKILAPFCPFVADEIFQKLNPKKSKISVHLEDWPKFGKSHINYAIISAMKIAREIAKIALGIRAGYKLKVRQPVSQIFCFQKIKDQKILDNLGQLLEQELNCKKFIFINNIQQLRQFKNDRDFEIAESNDIVVGVQIKLTPELKTEGNLREIIRSIQDLRKQAKLRPSDKIDLFWQTKDLNLSKIFQDFKNEISKAVNSKSMLSQKTKPIAAQMDIEIDNQKLWLAIKNK
jgi:isoleucyl-tRNA synthetase